MRYLKELATLVEAGRVRSHLTQTVTTAGIRAGYDRIESGRTVGKLAVDVAAARGAEPIEASEKAPAPS